MFWLIGPTGCFHWKSNVKLENNLFIYLFIKLLRYFLAFVVYCLYIWTLSLSVLVFKYIKVLWKHEIMHLFVFLYYIYCFIIFI